MGFVRTNETLTRATHNQSLIEIHHMALEKIHFCSDNDFLVTKISIIIEVGVELQISPNHDHMIENKMFKSILYISNVRVLYTVLENTITLVPCLNFVIQSNKSNFQ